MKFGYGGVVWRNGAKLCGDATWQGPVQCDAARPAVRPERIRPLRRSNGAADAVRGRSFGLSGTPESMPQKSMRRSRIRTSALRLRTHFSDEPELTYMRISVA